MADCIAYHKIPYYSKLILDYLCQEKDIQYAWHRFPDLANFEAQIVEKKEAFTTDKRQVLVRALQHQYQGFSPSAATQQNIQALAGENTFTVTTGHQLNLFSGPLYFLYKIITIINLTKVLKTRFPTYHFVPVYWLASEDHDFEEINYFNFRQHKIQWDSEQTGAVGRFSTQGLDKVFEAFDQELNQSDNAHTLRRLFREAYVNHHNLTDATRYLANKLLGRYGLVIIDGDDSSLKKVFSPHIKNELINQSAHQTVQPTAEKLAGQGYKVQVNPREINLFYLSENARNRIVKEEKGYRIHETDKKFTETEILEELDRNPENFSPNAIMRPLYQEVILPNLCYTGGSGELAYWLELKKYFEAEQVVFPILLLRNSALLISQKQLRKCEHLEVDPKDLFLSQEDLLDKHTRKISAVHIDFSRQKSFLKKQFEDLYTLAQKTDKSFIGAVAAQEKKQLNGLQHLEKRLLRAQKHQLKSELNRLISLQEALFPSGSLQEREANFSEFYEILGEDLIPLLFESLQPLKTAFNVIDY